MDFAVPTNHRVKNQRKQKDKEKFERGQRTKKTVEHEGDADTNCSWHSRNDPKRLEKWIERLKNQRKNQDHPDYSIVAIGQNTKKSSGDFRGLFVRLQWKTVRSRKK